MNNFFFHSRHSHWMVTKKEPMIESGQKEEEEENIHKSKITSFSY